MTKVGRYIAARIAALRHALLRSSDTCPVHGKTMERVDISYEAGWPAYPWICRHCEPNALGAPLDSAQGSERGWVCDTN